MTPDVIGTPVVLDSTAVAAISIAVAALTQIVKWSGLPDRRGPLAVLFISASFVLLWGWSRGSLGRQTTFDFIAAIPTVACTAAGIFGFTRAAPEAVTRTKQPPQGGAGSDPTV